MFSWDPMQIFDQSMKSMVGVTGYVNLRLLRPERNLPP